MAAFLISYDLTKPEAHEDYQRLWNRLNQLNAKKVLYSEWLMDGASARAIYDDIAQYVDGNDRLMVVKLTGEATWRTGGLMISDDEARRLLSS